MNFYLCVFRAASITASTANDNKVLPSRFSGVGLARRVAFSREDKVVFILTDSLTLCDLS
jgi:hypothetical protein